jgi:predicted aspartyl protease
MEIMTMGKVVVSARIENLQDAYEAEKGVLPADRIRTVEVADALVDTGATMLSIPRRLIVQLGLSRRRTRTARPAAGMVSFGIYGAVRLTVQGRDCIVEAAEIPDECPVLIGQIPLEGLDFVVDPTGQRLMGNPDHGGEQMIEGEEGGGRRGTGALIECVKEGEQARLLTNARPAIRR